MPPSPTASSAYEPLSTVDFAGDGGTSAAAPARAFSSRVASVLRRENASKQRDSALSTPNRTAIGTSPPRVVLEAGLELAGLAVIGAAVAAIGVLPLSWCGATIAALSYALVAMLVVAGLGRHAPHRSFGAANAITLSRAAFDVALLAVAAEQALGSGAVLGPGFRWGLTAAAGAALILDGLDGWVARRNNMTSPFGTRFDMEADALFLLGLTLVLIAGGIVGPWVLASGVTYYLFRVAGRLWPVLAGALFRSRRRKVIFGAQAILLIAALAPVLPPWLAQLCCLSGTTLLFYSFAVDIVWLLGRSPDRPWAPAANASASAGTAAPG
jgi:phosphatidylglycerophosphate synthase